MDFNVALKNPDLGYMTAPNDPLDIDAAKASFAPHKTRILEMLEISKEYNVNSRETNADAIVKISDAKTLTKKLEQERKNIVEAPNLFIRKVNSFVKEFTAPLLEIERVLKTKISQYQTRLEMERREQEKKAREEAAKLQAELDKEAKAKGVEPVKMAPVELAPVETVTRTEEGASAHIRKEWVGEIKDPEAVPREFCTPDMKLIREAVKAGKREIPGVKIYEKSTTVIRG